jgi:hypothetical protein
MQLSAPPLAGSYRVKCVTPAGIVSYTPDIGINSDEDDISIKINTYCHQMYEKVQVYAVNKYPYSQNGVRFKIRFKGSNTDPGQYEIVDGLDT